MDFDKDVKFKPIPKAYGWYYFNVEAHQHEARKILEQLKLEMPRDYRMTMPDYAYGCFQRLFAFKLKRNREKFADKIERRCR